MKLPKPGARLLAPGGGNLKLQAAPGEVHVNAFSDGSSTLPASTKWTLHEHLLFQRRLCRQGVAVMPTEKERSRF